MANFISEDNIEQAAIKQLVECHNYKAIRCYTESPDTLPDNSGRTDKKQVVAEQYREYPYNKARIKLVNSGVLGDISCLNISIAH